MDYDLHNRLIYKLKELEHIQKDCESGLSMLEDYKGCKLKRNIHKNGHSYYYYKDVGEKHYRYAGGADDKRVVRAQNLAHLSEKKDRVAKDAFLIRNLLDNYNEYDYISIDVALPIAYRQKIPLNLSRYEIVGEKWKTEKLAFQAMFPENYPQYKTERTSDGTMVKTKSEVNLYDRLIAAGLFVIYELPLPSKDYGTNLYPDFTVLSPVDMQSEIIIEYVGRLDLPQYRDDFAKRIYRLMQNGYTPGINLFFAFGDLQGHLDSMQIGKIIADIIGTR